MSSPLEELEAMASIQDRIDAVAKDLKSRVQQHKGPEHSEGVSALPPFF